MPCDVHCLLACSYHVVLWHAAERLLLFPANDIFESALFGKALGKSFLRYTRSPFISSRYYGFAIYPAGRLSSTNWKRGNGDTYLLKEAFASHGGIAATELRHRRCPQSC